MDGEDREAGAQTPNEYCAVTMKELCGEKNGHRLGGLPLAHAQAGSYIERFHYFCKKYLSEFKAASKRELQKAYEEQERARTDSRSTKVNMDNVEN